jgi:hypothetical protein
MNIESIEWRVERRKGWMNFDYVTDDVINVMGRCNDKCQGVIITLPVEDEGESINLAKEFIADGMDA